MAANVPPSTCDVHMTEADLSVLQVLIQNSDRVIGRETISRLAGLEADSARRADTSLVVLRRVLGPDSMINVRRRGWMLTIAGLAAAQHIISQQV